MQPSLAAPVRTGMRQWVLLAAAALLLVSTHQAAAERYVVHGVRPISIGGGFAAHTTKLAGLTAGGRGGYLEVAIGHGRWQIALEGSRERVELGPEGGIADGNRHRLGAGARWIARSFELGTNGTFDLVFEAFVGRQWYGWRGGAELVRNDVGLGVGFVDRLFIGRQQLAFSMIARVMFAPADRDAVAALCTGACMMPAQTSNSGIGLVAGVRW